MDYYFVERDHRKLVQETPREEYITKINNCHSSDIQKKVCTQENDTETT